MPDLSCSISKLSKLSSHFIKQELGKKEIKFSGVSNNFYFHFDFLMRLYMISNKLSSKPEDWKILFCRLCLVKGCSLACLHTHLGNSFSPRTCKYLWRKVIISSAHLCRLLSFSATNSIKKTLVSFLSWEVALEDFVWRNYSTVTTIQYKQ